MKVAQGRPDLDSGEYDAAQINENMFFAVVCHRIGLDSQAAVDRACFPAGTSHGWQLLSREDLPDAWWEGPGAVEASPTDDGRDAPYPQPCSTHPGTHVHVVAAC